MKLRVNSSICTDPTNCEDIGLTECCSSEEKNGCAVFRRDGTRCYCDSSCHARNDCCSDIQNICCKYNACIDNLLWCS